MNYKLKARYDNRADFYGKAMVEEEGEAKTLYSYGTKVVEAINDNITLYRDWDYSKTTLRHVKEFLRQLGKISETETTAQIRKQIRNGIFVEVN